MTRIFLLSLILFITGCDRVRSYMPSIPESKEAVAERQAKEIADREERARKLHDADKLVEKWADQIQQNQGSYEGITDPDPWENLIQIEYEQNGFYEYVNIRSLGPDGIPNTSDDLVRTRSFRNIQGIYRGLGGWGEFIAIYGISEPVAFLLSGLFAKRRKRLGRDRKSHQFALVLLAPIAIIAYTVIGLIIVFGSIANISVDGIDIPDFDFDFD